MMEKPVKLVSGEAQALLSQADESVAGQDDVVQDVYVQQGARLPELVGHGHVVSAGRGVARGVVVDDDNGGAALPHRVTEQIGYPNLGGVDGAFVYLRH